MRFCAGRIEDCEGGGLRRRRDGWTGRRTARVAHKRAGRRLRLQGDLERFPMLQRPLRSLRSGGCLLVETQRDAIGAWLVAASRCFLRTPCPAAGFLLLLRGVHSEQRALFAASRAAPPRPDGACVGRPAGDARPWALAARLSLGVRQAGRVEPGLCSLECLVDLPGGACAALCVRIHH